MNIKYKDLTIIGKIWSIADLFYSGLIIGNKKWVEIAYEKLETLNIDEQVQNSKAVLEHTIQQTITNAHIAEEYITGIREEYDCIDDESIASRLWFNKIELNQIKSRVKNDALKREDVLLLNEIYAEISHFWITDLKQKVLTSKERKELFKIREEVDDLLIKIENRINRDQIHLI